MAQPFRIALRRNTKYRIEILMIHHHFKMKGGEGTKNEAINAMHGRWTQLRSLLSFIAKKHHPSSFYIYHDILCQLQTSTMTNENFDKLFTRCWLVILLILLFHRCPQPKSDNFLESFRSFLVVSQSFYALLMKHCFPLQWKENNGNLPLI